MHETSKFTRELNLAPCTTALSSPQSNGVAERFVKTMKEGYTNLKCSTSFSDTYSAAETSTETNMDTDTTTSFKCFIFLLNNY